MLHSGMLRTMLQTGIESRRPLRSARVVHHSMLQNNLTIFGTSQIGTKREWQDYMMNKRTCGGQYMAVFLVLC